MITVLYTEDLEPITVISIPERTAQYLREHGNVILPVSSPPRITTTSLPREDDIRAVRISAERFFQRNREHLVLVTQDEESALLLKAIFLPGQQATLQEHQRQAFVQGFLTALHKLGAL